MSIPMLSPNDMLAIAAPTETDFYLKIGVAKLGVPANRDNIRKGLRFSEPMFKAVEEEFSRRLRHEGLWGKPIGPHKGKVDTIVSETIQSLPIPNHVAAQDPSFLLKSLHKLISLINEAPTKQEKRSLKRESTETQEDGHAKTQKLSTTERLANPYQSSRPSTENPPSIDSLQLIITDNLNECKLVSVQKLMDDPTVTSRFWEQLSLKALITHLRSKRFWGDTDENPMAPSRLTYRVDNASSAVDDDDDLQEACKYWERVRASEWRMFLQRAIKASIETSDIGASVFGTSRDLSVRSRPQSQRPPGTLERPAFPPIERKQVSKFPTSPRLADAPPQPKPAETPLSPHSAIAPPPISPPNPLNTHEGNETDSRLISISSDEGDPRPQVRRRSPQKKSVNDPTGNAAVLETYKSNDALPPWEGRRLTVGDTIPVELSIKQDHALRSADSYDIEIGEIMSQRKVQDDMEAGDGDLALEKAKLGEEGRSQWSEITRQIMEQVLQLNRDDTSTDNTRTSITPNASGRHMLSTIPHQIITQQAENTTVTWPVIPTALRSKRRNYNRQMRRTLRRNQAATRPPSSRTRLSSPRSHVICSPRFHIKSSLSKRRTPLQLGRSTSNHHSASGEHHCNLASYPHYIEEQEEELQQANAENTAEKSSGNKATIVKNTAQLSKIPRHISHPLSQPLS
ncbi:hypothetical protein HO173_012895 [Letharia columbiana]|uniref:Uncharacterized protein n=1 Tax=Letharia columbiana TaxID=112416 RepID=A0A8H6CKB4_9LECA|nr:uncharacterized protein HO173_012895 [Letharia columbiana]KAF6224686.1 hypothetical protein HO173_012895 [Letharia columbiana]